MKSILTAPVHTQKVIHICDSAIERYEDLDVDDFDPVDFANLEGRAELAEKILNMLAESPMVCGRLNTTPVKD